MARAARMSCRGPNRTEYYDHCFGHLPSTGQDLKPETLSQEYFQPTLRNALQRFRAGHLIVDPAISALQAITQTRRRFPVKNSPDQRVIAIAPVHTFRS